MQVAVHGIANPSPFLSARDLIETEFDVAQPVHVKLRENPDERTWTAHYDHHHVLNVSHRVASSAMARELALHEYAHMHQYEQGHASHRQSTREALYLSFAGSPLDDQILTHGVQIANHMKDIYADDITLRVGPGEKLVTFLESQLASAIASRGAHTDPSTDTITAVNAAFALALCERHQLVEESHRLYDFAEVAKTDADWVPFDEFKHRFRSLPEDPSSSQYRHQLVTTLKAYAQCVPVAD